MDPMPLARHRDTLCQQGDWILFPDPYEQPIIILHQGLHAIGADRCDEIQKAQKHSSSQRATRLMDTRISSCKDMKIPIEERNHPFRRGSDLFSPNPGLVRKATPQSRPSLQRLPTPDLPEIEESSFWPGLKSFHDCEVVNTTKLDTEYDQNGRNVDTTTKKGIPREYRNVNQTGL